MKGDGIFSLVLGCLFALYMPVSQIMALVFFVRYCKVDPLCEIIFVDTILAEIKGLLWIFFIW